MSTMYVTSAETFSGKSALCVGVGVRFRKDGLKAGYMKPVNVHCAVYEGLPYDEDVEFAKKIYGMTESNELLMPVALTPAKFEQQLRGPEANYAPRLMDAFNRLAERARPDGAGGWAQPAGRLRCKFAPLAGSQSDRCAGFGRGAL